MRTALRLMTLMLLLQACSTPEPVLPNRGQGDLFNGVKQPVKLLNFNTTFDYAWVNGKALTPNIPVTVSINGDVMKLTMGSHPVKSGKIKYTRYQDGNPPTYYIEWTYTNTSGKPVVAKVEYQVNEYSEAMEIEDSSGTMLLYR